MLPATSYYLRCEFYRDFSVPSDRISFSTHGLAKRDPISRFALTFLVSLYKTEDLPLHGVVQNEKHESESAFDHAEIHRSA